MGIKSVTMSLLALMLLFNVCKRAPEENVTAGDSFFNFSQLDQMGTKEELVIVASNVDIYLQSKSEGYQRVYKTLELAYEHVVTGDEIILTPGPYIPLFLDGEVDNITFTGFDAEIVLTSRDDPWWGGTLMIRHCNDIQFHNIVLRYGIPEEEPGKAVQIDYSSGITFSECTFEGDFDMGLIVNNSHDVQVISCEFRGLRFGIIGVCDGQPDEYDTRALQPPSTITFEGNSIYDIPLVVSNPWAGFDPYELCARNLIYGPDGSLEVEHFDLDKIDLDFPKEKIAIVSNDLDVIDRAKSGGYSGAYWYISDAIKVAGEGTAIVVCPGTYGPFGIGWDDDNITITGYDAEILSVEGWPIVRLNCASNISVSNLSIRHARDNWCLGGCVQICSSSDIEITSCDISGSGTWGICVDSSQNVLISDNQIHDCTDYGLLLKDIHSWFCSGGAGDSENVVAVGNYFYGNPTDLQYELDYECLNDDFREANQFDP